MKRFQLVVVGAGPAGLSAAVEGRRGGLSVKVLEKGESHSQMIRSYYKEGKRVDARYAGQEAICFGLLCLRDGNRETYLSLMDQVIDSHDIDIDYGTEVTAIHRRHENGVFEILRSNGPTIEAESIVVAIGRMGRPNRPDYDREIPMSLRERGAIRYEITQAPLADQDVLVVGGGDSAAEYCDMLSTDNTVWLSYRRHEFSKMNPVNAGILERLIRDGRVKDLRGTNIAGLADEDGGVCVRFAEEGVKPVRVDSVVYALGGMSPTMFLRAAGVQLGDDGEPLLNEHHETHTPWLYVVGDILGKGKGGGSIIAGFNSAAEAVRDLLIRRYQKHLEPEYVSLDHLNV